MSGQVFAYLGAIRYRVLICSIVWLLSQPFTTAVRADLVIALTSGQSALLLSDTEIDGDITTEDQIVTGVSLGFTGTFFDSARNTVDVSSNGNLNWSGNSSFGSVGGPSPVARISPLWDDFLFLQGTGGKVFSNIDPGNYFAVTWHNIPLWLEYYSHHTYTLYTFQVAWFGAPTQIGNFQFQPNDIAFSYATDLANLRDLYGVAGLNRGGLTTFIPFPGDQIDAGDSFGNDTKPGFMYAAEAKQILPSLTSDEFFLFRPDGNNSYNATRESLSGTTSSAVPEPSSLLLVTAAIGTSAWWHRRRRQRLTQSGAC
jgi:hypothetical protein